MLNPQAIQSVRQYLAQFAAKDDFENSIESIFGTKIGSDAIRQQWLSGDFSLIPEIRVLSNGELGTANGAYAASLDEIFVSSDFLSQHQDDVAAVAGVLLEEIGHKLDTVLNGSVDSHGDEGDIFRLLATGYDLSAQTLAGLKTQDDHAVITVDGQSVAVENQSFNGTNSNDTLIGTSGDDSFEPGTGADSIDGGAGNDLLYHLGRIDENADTIINYTTPANGIITGGFNNGTTFQNIERVRFTTGSGNDYINISAATVSINSGEGNDTLIGGAGDDSFAPGTGADSIDGGAGTNSLRLDYIEGSTATTTTIYTTLTNGTITGGSSNGTTFQNIQSVYIATGLGDNYVNVSAASSVYVSSFAGNDTLIGGNGDDTFNAQGGADSIDGGAGKDSLKIKYNNKDTVATTINYTTPTNGIITGGSSNGTTFRNIEIVEFETGSGNDYINVSAAPTVSIESGSGDDTLVGGAGDDVFDSGTGADSIDGGAGDDLLIRFYYNYNDTTATTIDYTTPTNGTITGGSNNGTTFRNIERVIFTTGSGDDYINVSAASGGSGIYSGAGNDTLIGGAGDDEFNAQGGGADKLSGGDGNDNYGVDQKLSGGTVIDDSSGTNDTLSLLGLTLSEISRNGTTLLIDLNKDGVFKPTADLSISNYFANTTGNIRGNGFIENLNGLNPSEVVNATINTNLATGTIVNDDRPVIGIEIADADTAEPNNPGQFCLTRTGITTADLTVKYSIAGTATNGTDYQNLTDTVTFKAGSSTATIDLNAIDDNIYEGNETVILTLTDSGTNYILDTVKSTATLTITDNESIPIIAEGDEPNISLLVTDADAVEELANPGQFTFKRTGDTTNSLTVNYSLSGTATNESDYQKLGNTITFAAGSNTTTLDINPIDDKRYEGTETVTLSLLDGGTQYKLDPSNSGTVSIVENDPQTPKLTQPLPNILSIEGGGDRSTLKFTKIAQEGAGKNETFAFVVDDDKGRIGGIVPGAEGYLKAALDRSKVIFSNLGNNSIDRTFDLGSQRSLTFAPGDLVEFGSIVGDTIDKVKLDLISGKPTSEVLFSLPSANAGNGDRAKFTPLPNDGGYEIAWSNADTKTTPVYNDLVFKVESINNFTAPIGTNLQGNGEGEVLDLRSFAGQTLKIDTVAVSDAGYNNNIGFYAVADAQGTLANGLKVTDVGYAEAAIKSAILRSFKNETQLDRQVAGGEILAPVVIANGTFEDFLKTNPQNQANSNINAYFNYLGANTDKVDHFRLLGDNKFGVEDLYGGGDRDYNDVVFQLNVKV